QLAAMLASYDLKRDDAITLLETLARPHKMSAAPRPEATRGVAVFDEDDREDVGEAAARLAAGAPLLFWEVGPPVAFGEVVRFLAMTGELPRYARHAVARFALEGNDVDVDLSGGPSDDQVRADVLERIGHSWLFGTEEEARVSLGDLGIGTESFEERVDE